MCKVLIVEDHPDALRLIVRLLTHRGHTVSEARTAAEGMTMLDGQAAAILDYHLPDVPGSAVLAKIREEKRPMRVAYWTASDVGRAAAIWENNPDEVFFKPADLNKMLAWLDTV